MVAVEGPSGFEWRFLQRLLQDGSEVQSLFTLGLESLGYCEGLSGDDYDSDGMIELDTFKPASLFTFVLGVSVLTGCISAGLRGD